MQIVFIMSVNCECGGVPLCIVLSIDRWCCRFRLFSTAATPQCCAMGRLDQASQLTLMYQESLAVWQRDVESESADTVRKESRDSER